MGKPVTRNIIFKYITKLNTFFKYSDFICGKDNGLNANFGNYEVEGHALLSIYRLMGCEYFMVFYDIFETQIKNPIDLYNFYKDENKSLLDNHLAK